MLQPAKVATPATAALGFAVQVSVAPPVPVLAVIVRVTGLLSPVAAVPPTVGAGTTGGVRGGRPLMKKSGWGLNAICAGGPGLMVMGLLAVGVGLDSVAVRL